MGISIRKNESEAIISLVCILKKKTEAYFATLPSEIREDSALLVPDLPQEYGYPCENHTVVTPDGSILEMHRILHGKKSFPDKRSVIYLQHGILASSADWVLPGPRKGFAYILADFSYDVLMSNVRGTRYSRKHTYLDPERHSLEFWDFSWHEIGVIHIPTMIDYI
ncbi:hypothetical protein ILUMI_14725 [Ignelater luminosus]|uniref:Partial AB-hydrolase lipase domain-containing protein n=1 Tax=Ignelater luminosus TaxID=2038154 RepID=A0A8K0GAN1_IGNLU|nr:hypothetical protein ILUMI_14725 [Ignelater luminosus]